MTSGEYFHEISSRFVNNELHACSVPEQQHAVIIHRLSVSVEIITAIASLKKDESVHLERQGGL